MSEYFFLTFPKFTLPRQKCHDILKSMLRARSGKMKVIHDSRFPWLYSRRDSEKNFHAFFVHLIHRRDLAISETQSRSAGR